jgi:hypothetical protein
MQFVDPLFLHINNMLYLCLNQGCRLPIDVFIAPPRCGAGWFEQEGFWPRLVVPVSPAARVADGQHLCLGQRIFPPHLLFYLCG